MSGSHLWEGSMRCITGQERTFLPAGIPEALSQATLLQRCGGDPLAAVYILLHPQHY